MSRTIRRLPLTGGSLKRYASTSQTCVKRHGMTLLFYRTEVSYLFSSQERTKREISNITASGGRVKIVHGGFKVLNDCVVQKTEEDVKAEANYEQLYWCRKNKTCRRQRKNGVKSAKRLAARQFRARQKAELNSLLRDET